MVLHNGRSLQFSTLATLTFTSLLLLQSAGCEGTPSDADTQTAPDSQPSTPPAQHTTDDAPPASDTPPVEVAGEPTPDVPAPPMPGPDMLEGELNVTVADFDDGTTHISYELVTTSGDRHTLQFSSEPSLASGDRVRVLGVAQGSGFVVQGLSLLNEADEGTPPLLALTKNATRQTGRIAALLVNWASADSLTTAQLDSNLFTSTTSAAEFHREVSYNLNQLDGDVFGWLTVPAMTNCDTSTLAKNAQAAAKTAGIDLSAYGQVAYYFPQTSQCAWAGLATIGRPKSPARESWFNGASSCGVLAHELGHNIGAQHARSYDCGTSTLAPAASCTYSEYGDLYDVMGGGQCTHPSTYLKSAEGWFGGCNVVTATANGTFDLNALELPSDLLQGLRIPMDASLCPTGLTSCFYYLEVRQAQGKFDVKSNTAMFAGVLLHVGSAVDFSGNGRPQAPYLLDTTPGSRSNDFQDAPLGVGKTFSDGKGVSITVNSLTSAGARVTVTLTGGTGAPTCLDGTVYSTSSTPPGVDAGIPVVDASVPPPRVDASVPDAGVRDAGAPALDAGRADAGSVVVDAGSGTSTDCGAGGSLFNGHCYAAITATANFDDARAACASRGAGWSLAEINSAQENQYVASLNGTRESWLGATDRAREGTWVWLSGTTFWAPTFLFFYGPVNGRYTSFVAGEPNDGGGNSDCLRMVSGGGWRDGNCADVLPSICEH